MINANLEKPAPAKAARPSSRRTIQPVEATGACIYFSGSRTRCELLTKPACEQLAGIWLPERDCSKILGLGGGRSKVTPGTRAAAGNSGNAVAPSKK